MGFNYKKVSLLQNKLHPTFEIGIVITSIHEITAIIKWTTSNMGTPNTNHGYVHKLLCKQRKIRPLDSETNSTAL